MPTTGDLALIAFPNFVLGSWLGLRLPVERLKIEPAVQVEGNPLIFEQSALQRRTHPLAGADTPLGVDYSVPGQVLRASLERISNPTCSDA